MRLVREYVTFSLIRWEWKALLVFGHAQAKMQLKTKLNHAQAIRNPTDVVKKTCFMSMDVSTQILSRFASENKPKAYHRRNSTRHIRD